MFIFFLIFFCFFFFNDTATTEIYTLSLHDALPIQRAMACRSPASRACRWWRPTSARSEEHTSELQSRSDLVCRLLLERKKKEWVKCSHYKQEIKLHLNLNKQKEI